MVFKKGGNTYEHEKRFNGNTTHEVVKGFNYVGVHFTPRLSQYRMAKHMAGKGERVLLHILSFMEIFYLFII